MAAECVVGVDVGGTKAMAGVIDESLTLIHRARREMPGLDQAGVIDAIVDAVDEVRAASEIPPSGVGVGMPCLLDQRTGEAVMAVNLPIADLPIRDVLSERLGLPVFIDNDANVAALAEHRFGAAQGASTAVVLTVGTGVGGGLIVDGEPRRGSVGAGAELGHVVIDYNGPRCQGNCPNRGCLEVMASGTALTRESQRIAEEQPETTLGRARADGQPVTGELVTELALAGDEQCRELIALIGRRLGVGIASFVNIFNPEVVVVGGGVIAAGELLLEPARQEMLSRALPFLRDLVRVVPAEAGQGAGLLGAGVLAFDGLAKAR